MPRQSRLDTRSEQSSERRRDPSKTRFPCGLAMHSDLPFRLGSREPAGPQGPAGLVTKKTVSSPKATRGRQRFSRKPRKAPRSSGLQV